MEIVLDEKGTTHYIFNEVEPMVNICYFAYIPLIFIVPWLVYEFWKYKSVKQGGVKDVKEDRGKRGRRPSESRGRVRYESDEEEF